MQVNEYEVYIDCTSADRLVEQTGKHAAIMGLEGMSAIAYPPYASYLIDRAVTQTAAKLLPQLREGLPHEAAMGEGAKIAGGVGLALPVQLASARS